MLRYRYNHSTSNMINEIFWWNMINEDASLLFDNVSRKVCATLCNGNYFKAPSLIKYIFLKPI